MIYREMTAARIREPKGGDYVEVVFLESARFYRLRKDHPAFEAALRLLRAAVRERGVLDIGLASLDGDTIEQVSRRASPDDLRAGAADT